METIQKKTWHDVKIEGRYRLLYKVGNSQGAAAFGGYHLPVYPNPFTGQKTFLKNADGKPLNGYMIDRTAKVYHPDDDINIKYLISWLICHPEVRLEGIKNVDETILKKKITSTKITLICMDGNEMDKFEEEDYIDKLIGVLSLDLGTNAVSLAKLRHVLAYLDMTYREPRFEGKAEKSALRSRLKTFVRGSYENAKSVNNALENIDLAQSIYEFKEMVRTKVIEMENGVYKYNKAPLGTAFDTVNVFFQNHPEVKAEVQSKLYNIIK